MRRRVARVLRVGAFVLGLLVLGCLPASFFYSAYAAVGSWYSGYGIGAGGGWFVAWTAAPDAGGRTAPIDWAESRAWLNPYRGSLSEFDAPYWPPVHTLDGTHVFLQFVKVPLWLLALICLAWPVTSFIIARRRHKRGFPVEPKGRIADSDWRVDKRYDQCNDA
jgi:hypothetical protein